MATPGIIHRRTGAQGGTTTVPSWLSSKRGKSYPGTRSLILRDEIQQHEGGQDPAEPNETEPQLRQNLDPIGVLCRATVARGAAGEASADPGQHVLAGVAKLLAGPRRRDGVGE